MAEEKLFFISFGSGAVATRVASDEVRLGAVKTYMENGLLLVVRQAGWMMMKGVVEDRDRSKIFKKNDLKVE